MTSDGVLIIDKPAGMTSHDVVARVRRLAGTRKVGHAGTLDPMATGVLLVGLNRATRLLTYLVGADKSYVATVRLGESTVTDDAQGQTLPPGRTSDRVLTCDSADPHDWAAVAGAVEALAPERIRAAAATLTGEIDQVPSAVSAIKVNGLRSYARVRAGDDVELPARRVRVYRFDVGEPVRTTGAHGPVLDVPIEVDVSSGTYIRALARDLGAALGVGGHLTMLRRTRVGGFGLDRAHRLQDLVSPAPAAGQAPGPSVAPMTAYPPNPARSLPADGTQGSAMTSGRPRLPLLGMAEVAQAALPVRRLEPTEAADLAQGRPVSPDPFGRSGPVAAIDADGRLVAILTDRSGQARPAAVFAVH